MNINPTTVNAAEDALDELFYRPHDGPAAGTYFSYREETDVAEQVLAIRTLVAECRAAGAVLEKIELEHP